MVQAQGLPRYALGRSFSHLRATGEDTHRQNRRVVRLRQLGSIYSPLTEIIIRQSRSYGDRFARNSSRGLILAGSLSSRGRRGRNYARGSHGEHNPKNDVSKSACPGKEHSQKPQDPHDRGIKIKIIGQAGTHTCNLFIGARAHQFLLAARRRGEAWRGSFRLFGAAVVAKPRTHSDVFLTVYASHWVTPAERFIPASLPLITKMGSKKFPSPAV